MTGVYVQMQVGLRRQCDGCIYTNEGRIEETVLRVYIHK